MREGRAGRESCSEEDMRERRAGRAERGGRELKDKVLEYLTCDPVPEWESLVPSGSGQLVDGTRLVLLLSARIRIPFHSLEHR